MKKWFALGFGLILFYRHPVWANLTDPTIQKSESLRPVVQSVLQKISQLRGQVPGSRYTVKVSNPKDLQAYILKRSKSKLTPDQLLLDSWSLVATRMSPNPIDSIKLLQEFAGGNVAGFFDPESKTLSIVDWIPPNQAIPVLAHELTHLLQDQSLSLEEFIHLPTRRESTGIIHVPSDETHARHALVEGEAVLMMALTLESMGAANGLSSSDDVGFFLGNVTQERQKIAQRLQVPEEVVQTALFSYEKGYPFVRALWTKNGFNLIKKAFRCPPRSTKEILEVKSYLARVESGTDCESQTPLSLSPIETRLIERFPASKGKVFRTELGAFGTQLFVKFHQKGNPEPSWIKSFKQDQFYVFLSPSPPQKAGFLWVSQWENEGAAENAYHDFQFMTASVNGSSTSPAQPLSRSELASMVEFEGRDASTRDVLFRSGNQVVLGWAVPADMTAILQALVAGETPKKLN